MTRTTQETAEDAAPPTLRRWGWSPFFSDQIADLPPELVSGTLPGRIVLELRGVSRVVTEQGFLEARIPGRMHHTALTGGELPTVGDWVLVRPPERDGEDGWIEHVFQRRSKFSRQAAGARTREQVVAANVDRFLVMMGADGDFRPRRLERYVSSIREGGAEVVILLNKLDLADDLDSLLAEIAEAAPGCPVHALSAKHDRGLDVLDDYLREGVTLALVGSSGVGKSTLLNRLLGEERMKTGAVRDTDDRGRHTTSHRELIRLPGGALLMDNPGIRELQLWESGEGLEDAFPEINEIAANCRFGDCSHEEEPGCAVRAAVEAGEISRSRLRSYRKLRDEQAERTERQEHFRRKREKQRTRAVHRALREKNRRKRFD